MTEDDLLSSTLPERTDRVMVDEREGEREVNRGRMMVMMVQWMTIDTEQDVEV